ncbi:MAG TPA: ABC transporter ATP-binding protein [Actinomycetota bacterium]
MPQPESEPGLVLRGVSVGYGGGPALRGVSLRVRPGEVVGLVGPNGSGKTTLVRVASRALRPHEGRVRVAGRDPYGISAREAARLVAVVPQDVVPAFSFTALEMVLMGRSPYLSPWGGGGPKDWARVRDAMMATAVQHLADRPVDELSGGERRRVILAQALAQDAPVLLLDEPTTHLDLRHVVDLLSIVRGLADREGTAILAIHHDLTLAAASCDRLAVLDRGTVVADGPPEDVVDRDLLRSVYGVEGDVVHDEASGRPAVRLGPPRAVPVRLGRRAHVVGGAGRGAPLMRRLVRAGFDVSAGVLHATDTDAAVAERLNLLRVLVPPFSAIDAAAAQDCRGLMEQADLLVVCDAPYGPGNVDNLSVALEVARSGVRTVVIEEVPIVERDFTSGRATELWNALREVSEVAFDYDEVVVDVG